MFTQIEQFEKQYPEWCWLIRNHPSENKYLVRLIPKSAWPNLKSSDGIVSYSNNLEDAWIEAMNQLRSFFN